MNDRLACWTMERVKEFVTSIRAMKHQHRIPPGKRCKAKIVISSPLLLAMVTDAPSVLRDIQHLANVDLSVEVEIPADRNTDEYLEREVMEAMTAA